MRPATRHGMAWIHTWLGLVLGFVLIVVFFFGALSVFDREFDRWALPQTRFEPQPMPSFDRILRPAFERITAPDADDLAAAAARVTAPLPARLPLIDWSAYTTHRDPVLELYASFALPNARIPGDHIHGHVTIDPRTGAPLAANELKIGSGFFYPLHYGLHLEWRQLGYFIVGLAALTMLVALVSGVVIHRRLLRELFTFRPDAHRQRATLDLHNLTGVVALPFHLFFALSGLVIFAAIYFPVTFGPLASLTQAHEREEAIETGLPSEPAGRSAGLASVDAMVADAQRRWAAHGLRGEVGYLFLNHVGDENGYVSVYRAGTDRVALTGQGVHYRAATGELIREDPPAGAVARVNEFLTGLHLQHFRHWTLRWLYVFGGLAGCLCIATGFLFFVEKRRARHASGSATGLRLVEAMSVGTITGTVFATLVLLVATRALPVDLDDRALWQERAFWWGWLAAFAHAGLRGVPRAWLEQCVAIAALGVLVPLLNAVMTDDPLWRTLARGYWPVAGVDLAVLATAVVALRVAVRLRSRTRVALARTVEALR